MLTAVMVGSVGFRNARGLLLAPALLLACSGSASNHELGENGGAAASLAGASSDDRLFVPEGLPNTLRAGDEPSGLTLIAFTLELGAAGPALYAAVRNDGTAPSCEAGMLTDFFDQAGALVGSAGTTLQSRQFYRTSTGAIIPCLDPGEVAMGASTTLPQGLDIGALGALSHAFPAFTVDDITPTAGLTVTNVNRIETGAGKAYTGNLDNGFAVSVSHPTVAIFPLNGAGRPLGVATSSLATDILAGASSSFVTSSVSTFGVDDAAYSAASVANEP